MLSNKSNDKKEVNGLLNEIGFFGQRQNFLEL